MPSPPVIISPSLFLLHPLLCILSLPYPTLPLPLPSPPLHRGINRMKSNDRPASKNYGSYVEGLGEDKEHSNDDFQQQVSKKNKKKNKKKKAAKVGNYSSKEILTCPFLFCLAFPCFALSCLALPYFVLPYPAVPCLFPCPVMPSSESHGTSDCQCFASMPLTAPSQSQP